MRIAKFEDRLAKGRRFEDICAAWLKMDGWLIDTKYDSETLTPPVMASNEIELALPDIIACKGGRALWIEAKFKNRMLQHPATGFSTTAWIKYLRLQKESGINIIFLFCDKKEGTEYYGASANRLLNYVYNPRFLVQGKPHMLFKHPEAFIPFDLGDSFTEKLTPMERL